MKLRNVLIVVKDIEQSKKYYHDLFGLEMLLHGEVRHYDFSNLKQLNASIGRIAGSINQIAKRCNENKSVHTNDVEQLRREFLELKADYLERVVKLLRKIY